MVSNSHGYQTIHVFSTNFLVVITFLLLYYNTKNHPDTRYILVPDFKVRELFQCQNILWEDMRSTKRLVHGVSSSSLTGHLPFFLETSVGISWYAMLFTSSFVSSNLTVLPRFLLPPEQASYSLHGRCTAYLAYYSSVTLHSSVDFQGACNKHIFPPVSRLLRLPAFLVLRLPVRPFLGLVGEADSFPFGLLS